MCKDGSKLDGGTVEDLEVQLPWGKGNLEMEK